jgi:hypothetical protein
MPSTSTGRVAAALALACIALGALYAPVAQAQDGTCQHLQKTYQQELGSADSLKAKAAQQAMQSGSQALNKLGIQLGSSSNAQQAIEKGALAASGPQMQGAIMVQLLSADTHMQEMIWRGCKPSSG